MFADIKLKKSEKPSPGHEMAVAIGYQYAIASAFGFAMTFVVVDCFMLRIRNDS